MTRRACAWVWLTGLVLLTGSCSVTVPLRNVAVAVPRTARLGPGRARFFVDRVKVPYRRDERLGVKRSLAGDFWARVYSSGDLAAWAEREWLAFLRRHGQEVVTRVREADYLVTCDLLEVSADKKYDWIWDDDFSGSVKLFVRIVDRRSGVTVFCRTLRGDHFLQRRGQYQEYSDSDLLLLCASSAFQKALEQITF
ncbi:MAG: hypothetical protein N2595_10130 [bacterium]|nr:hypothetical protein [bacterium]